VLTADLGKHQLDRPVAVNSQVVSVERFITTSRSISFLIPSPALRP